jgi:hypothetical protein
VPILCTQTVRFQDWLGDTSGDEEIPRHFGVLDFSIGRGTALEVGAERAMFSYDQWMLQRVLDAYQALAEAEKAVVESFLERVGAADLLHLRLHHRVARRNFTLVRG